MINISLKTWKSARLGVVLALLLGVGLSGAWSPAHAQAASLEEATSQVKDVHPGCRILRADTIVRDNGDTVYRLKVLTSNGTVKTVRVRSSDDGRPSRNQRSHTRRFRQ